MEAENVPAVGTAIIKRNQSHMLVKQEEIFTNWANYILSRRGLRIESVKDDMANGVLLIQLVEILCDDTIERYNKKPSMLVHCIENITIAMAFLKDHGFDPSGVAIAEVAKGDPKSVMGLFWCLIAHFQLRDLRNKWDGQEGSGNEHLNKLQAELDKLQEEQNKRKEAGEERKKLMTERASRRKALLAAQKLFVAKGNEFKAWAEGKTVELKLWKMDGALDVLEAELASMDNDITQECDTRLSEIAKLWKACEEAGAEETPSLLGEMRQCVATLESVLEDTRVRLERKGLQDSFTDKAEKFKTYVDKTVAGLGTLPSGEDLKKALARIDADQKEIMVRADEMKGDAEKVWKALMEKGGPEGVIPYNKYSLEELREKLEDALAKYKDNLKVKMQECSHQDDIRNKQLADFEAEARDYKKWGKDLQLDLPKEIANMDADNLEPLKSRRAALAAENDKRSDKLKQMWKELHLGDSPSSEVLSAHIMEDLEALHANVDDALKAYGDAVAKKEKEKKEARNALTESAEAYKTWAKATAKEINDRNGGSTPGDLLRATRALEEASHNIRADNNEKRDHILRLMEEYARYGGIVARSDVDAWHAEVEAALSQKSKQFEEEIKKAEEGQGTMMPRMMSATGSTLIRRRALAAEAANPCKKCKGALERTNVVLVDGVDLYHASCFICGTCKCEFEQYYWEWQQVPYCHPHYIDAAGLVCGGCGKRIEEDKVTIADGKKWHTNCFGCTTCHSLFDEGYYAHEDKPYCFHHYMKARGLLCAKCDEPVEQGDKSWEKKAWHRKCWVCTTCEEPFGADGFFGHEGKPYCPTDYKKLKQK